MLLIMPIGGVIGIVITIAALIGIFAYGVKVILNNVSGD